MVDNIFYTAGKVFLVFTVEVLNNADQDQAVYPILHLKKYLIVIC